MKVVKRDGRKVEFNTQKIIDAVLKAFKEVDGEVTNESEEIAYKIANMIIIKMFGKDTTLTVEDIQDMVESELMSTSRKDVAKAYILYRDERTRHRKNTIDDVVMEIIDNSNDYWVKENSNKDSQLATTMRDYVAGAVSTDISRRKLLPKEIVKAHDEGIIHFHDADYFLQPIYNCCLINLEDMLQNGTVISKTKIDKPHKFSTACNIATQIIAQVASSQYGGQSISLSHLAPFVESTRQKFREEYPELTHETIEKMVRHDISDGIQTLQYQIITLMTTNGQAPFITVYLNIAEPDDEKTRNDLAICIEEVLKQRIRGVKNEVGVYISPAFPKLIYALDELNITEDSKYYHLTELAAKCSAKRLVPDYISNKVERQLKDGNTYTCMGCRSFLTVDRTTENYSNAINWENGKKYYGRFNQGVVTINLIDVALSSQKDMDKFWNILDERLELCHKALRCRHERLNGTLSDVAPILWQNGAIARLEKGQVIDELLYHGYSTISLGYAGIYEMTRYMIGESHTSERGKEFAINVMKRLNEACVKWKSEEDIDYSLYGSPIESTTYKFAKCLKKRFGDDVFVKIDGFDRDYITNSYHVNVREEISVFDKLAIESEFQELSPGGAISYCECCDLTNNVDAVLDVIRFIYDNIMYAELNTKSDYCHVCGYDGEIKIIDEDNKLVWECPNCGNRDQNKMNVTRRTCGYIGTNFWNEGRTEEIRDRYVHIDNHEMNV